MSRKRRRKPRKIYDRKNWTPLDPCMKCGAPGPHVVEFSHVSPFGKTFKASCFECGTYQKFLNEEQAEPFATSDEIDQAAIDAPY